ncbi:MAG: DUF4337 domain-containing protein [Pseudomonadota bacterium]|nr:DUF4337 domain-containing protein [Pseudomonadota bacterium]
MTEEIESPTEKIEEHIHHAAAQGADGWLKWCALMAALYAVMAAISGLAASSYANDAMMEQIRASDQWGYYQAKGIKALVVETQNAILKKMAPGTEASPDPTLDARTDKYRHEEEEIKTRAEALSRASEKHMEKHETIARAVTCFQVAIALIAIVILTKRRRLLALSALLGLAGAGFLVAGML